MPAVEKSWDPRSPDWVESWESVTLLMTARWGCVMLALVVLDRIAAGCSTADFGLLALSWTGGYHICCDTALWPSHFMSPLSFHTLNSCMKWHDTFSIPFSFFCLSPLLLSFVFVFCVWFSFFKVGKTMIFFVSQHHKNPQMKNSANQCYRFPHTYKFFCSSMPSILEAQLWKPSREKNHSEQEGLSLAGFLICLTFLPLSQLSRCFCSSLNPALTGSHLLKDLLIYSTLVTWGSAIAPIYLTKYSPNEI